MYAKASPRQPAVGCRRRNHVVRELTECPPWTVYGCRGLDPDLHRLSAYDFAMHFHIKQAKFPHSLAKPVEQPGLGKAAPRLEAAQEHLRADG